MAKIEELADSALLHGIIEAECVDCDILIQCEPDAGSAWCDNCNKLVKVRNYLKMFGLI